ncbi:MAG: glycosyltransferase family 2 protein [Lewinellaceae bacterium]|nr:glycosyltransferase family 2 protein [Lewinellaceae bacterium]
MNSPLVSVLIPCLNEERFIGKVLQNILDQSYPTERLEVFVIDGGSRDRTRTIVETWSKAHPQIALLDNPDRYVPHALNRGIRAATGDIIFIMGAHASYPRDYIRKLVQGLKATSAQNVGGVCLTEPRSETPKARAIAAVLRHPLGVGNSLFRIGVEKTTEVDTVPFGCYPRAVFDTYGLFDERLLRNQDIEFNKRIYNSGGKILLLPEVQCTYYARDTFQGLWKNNFGNGLWVVRTAFLTRQLSSLSLRHFVPMAFVLYLLSAIILSLFGWWIAWLPFLLYFILTGIAGLRISIRERNFAILPFSRIAFGVLHISYGVGSLWGLLSILKFHLYHSLHKFRSKNTPPPH